MTELQTRLDDMSRKPELFRFSHRDGFTEQLRSVGLIIYEDGTCDGMMTFYPKPGMPKQIELLHGPVPQPVIDALHHLLKTDDLTSTLQGKYGVDFDDADEQEYVIGPKTVKVIGLSKKGENAFQTPAEKNFIAFRRLLDQWLAERWIQVNKSV